MEDSPHNPQIHYAQAHRAESVGNGKTATTGFTTSTCGKQHPAVMKRQLLPQATSTDSNNLNSTQSRTARHITSKMSERNRLSDPNGSESL